MRTLPTKKLDAKADAEGCKCCGGCFHPGHVVTVCVEGRPYHLSCENPTSTVNEFGETWMFGDYRVAQK